ncbi:MAG: hypothetical protein EYX74_05650 [Desulfobulbaceae bacterium]|nr:MAG: hypothetical protein EYX74_05650 [Desulfobulbaceae bacterium]
MGLWITAKRWRIMLVGILLSVTPLVILAAFVFFELRSHIPRLLMDAHLQSAKLLAGKITNHLNHDTSLARAYAARPLLVEGVRHGDRRTMEQHLRNLIENAAHIGRAYIVSPVGIKLAAYPANQAVLGQDFSHRGWFQGVSKDWQPYISSL